MTALIQALDARAAGGAAAHSPLIRVGVPLPSGELTRRAIDSGLPLLFSANAFAVTDADKRFTRFRLKAAEALPRDRDIALDSGGFVAAARYGDYRFSIDEYLDLVAAGPWTWYASPDYCVEPQVAENVAIRRLRMEATLANYARCSHRAERRGLPAPMPVIQGYAPDDYAWCIENMPLDRWPKLVGVGSVCRRHLGGENGLLRVIDRIDRMLPPGVALHLFGVKSGSLAALRPYGERIHSMDSAAWDMGVRYEHPTGRTQRMRAEAMVRWHQNQTVLVGTAVVPPLQRELDVACERTVDDVVAQAVGTALASLYGSGDLAYRECSCMTEADLTTVRAVIQVHGIEAFEQEEPGDDFGLGIVYSEVRDALIAEGLVGASA